MRIPRTLLLPQVGGGLVHKCWRAHNKEFLLSSAPVKSLYLKSLFSGLKHKSVKSEVSVSAYCIMSNHAHVLVKYVNKSLQLSNFMRVAHSRFGQAFNRLHKRQGPVAYDRPKTPLVQQSIANQMRVHFYIEANPLRAKMVKNLKLFKYSSFLFYAWGIKNEYTSQLTIPQWYMDLGKNQNIRQSKYRSLFNKYLKELLTRISSFTGARFIGEALWVLTNEQRFASDFAELKATYAMVDS